jgi:hypothetical protein
MNNYAAAIITNATKSFTSASNAIPEQAIIKMVMDALKISAVEAKVEFEIALDEVWDVLNLQSTLVDAKTPQLLLSGETAQFIPCIYRG